MMTERFDPSVTVAIAVAVLGAIPGMWLVASQPDPPADLAPAVILELPPAAITVTPVEVARIEPIEVAELDDSVTAALQTHGFLGRTDPGDLEAAALDPSVEALLREHDVVLRIAQDPAAP